MRNTIELPNIARIGALIGNPVRAQFIGALMDGSERSASELAGLVHATPQTASSHLASLVAGGLLTVRPQGRHRFYRLSNERVAEAIEVLSLTVMEMQPAGLREDIRSARRCYDHVSGRLGVTICDFAVARKYVAAGGEGVMLTKVGERWRAGAASEAAALRRAVLSGLDGAQAASCRLGGGGDMPLARGAGRVPPGFRIARADRDADRTRGSGARIRRALEAPRRPCLARLSAAILSCQPRTGS